VGDVFPSREGAMLRKLSTWIVVVLVGAAFAVGVGGGVFFAGGGSSHKSTSSGPTTSTHATRSPAVVRTSSTPATATARPAAARKPATIRPAAARKPATTSPTAAPRHRTTTPAAAPRPATSSPAAVPAPATAATPTPSGATTDAGTPERPSKEQAVAACKRLQVPPTITANARIKLDAICEKAVGGNAPHKVVQELCTELVNASPIPAGPAKERALERCKSN
jgi:hypothetical protein